AEDGIRDFHVTGVQTCALPIFTFLAGALALTSADLYAQRNWNRVTTDDATAVDTLTKKKYTLIFIDKSPDLNPQVKERLIDAFFTTYPKEAKDRKSVV